MSILRDIRDSVANVSKESWKGSAFAAVLICVLTASLIVLSNMYN